jgi:hypothetical protein
MKKALWVLSIAAVFSLALLPNAYAGSNEDQSSQGQESMGMMGPYEMPGSTSPPSGGFNSYGSDYRGGQVIGNSQTLTWGAGEAYRPWLVPGTTTPPSGGFGSYGGGAYTEVENPEKQMQTHYGQAPSSAEEEGQPHPFLTPGSTTPPSGGFGYY